MKKIWTKIKEWSQRLVAWWMLHFRNTLVQEVEFGAFTVTFRRFTMDIKTHSNNLQLRTIGMVYPNALFLNALENKDTKIIEWFCYQLYQYVTLITTDTGLVNDVNKAFSKYYKRKEKEAKSEAHKVTEEDDMMAQGTIETNIEYAGKTKKEREEYKEALREVLTEGNVEWLGEK